MSMLKKVWQLVASLFSASVSSAQSADGKRIAPSTSAKSSDCLSAKWPHCKPAQLPESSAPLLYEASLLELIGELASRYDSPDAPIDFFRAWPISETEFAHVVTDESFVCDMLAGIGDEYGYGDDLEAFDDLL